MHKLTFHEYDFYENRAFPLTVLKQSEKSLWTSNKYIDQYFLYVTLFSIRHRNHLGSEKLSILRKTFMK